MELTKTKTARSEKYLNFIRAQECCVCLTAAPSQAAHVRIGTGGGMGLKPSDYFAVPLCASCHRIQHMIGERSFWHNAQTDPERIIIECMYKYVNSPVEFIRSVETFVRERRKR